MNPPDPHMQTPPHSSGGAGDDEPPAQGTPLEGLAERVRAAQDAAERLVAEATETARATGEPFAGRRAGSPPPRGWAAQGDRTQRGSSAEAQALAALLDLSRSAVPPELRQALADLVRELLLLLRSLIDWYLERLEARRPSPVEVEDIPIS